MRALIIFFLLVLLATACSKKETESTEAEKSDPRFAYSSLFKIADTSNSEIVRKWNNALASGNIDEAFLLAADSLEVVLPDGSMFHSTRDSLKSVVHGMLSGVENFKIGFIAAVPVTSIDKDATWVLSYTDESFTSEGKPNRQIAHELYQIVNGKIRTVYAFSRVPTEDDLPATNSEGYVYSGSFEILPQEKVNIITTWYDNLFNNNYSVADQYIADSVDLFFPEGIVMKVTRDSLLNIYKGVLSSAKIEISYSAGVALRSIDKNEEWVLLWYDEKVTSSEGTETNAYHELYRIVDNKMRSARLFKQLKK